MDSTNKVVFDELDKKVLSELPIIFDVLSATFSKISNVFLGIHDDVLKVCKRNLPEGWEINKKIENNSIYPFTDSIDDDKIDCSSISSHLEIKNKIQLDYRINKKLEKRIEVKFGLFFDNEGSDKPFYYLYIANFKEGKNKDNYYNNSYYQELKTKFDKLEFDIAHPENGDDFEYFQILIKNHDIKEITEGAKVFTNDILPDFLKGIK